MKPNPKERAKQIYEKIYSELIQVDSDVSEELNISKLSKVIALHHVDEIIKSAPSLPIEGKGGYFYEDIELSIKWFKKVRKEIEKL